MLTSKTSIWKDKNFSNDSFKGLNKKKRKKLRSWSRVTRIVLRSRLIVREETKAEEKIPREPSRGARLNPLGARLATDLSDSDGSN